MLHILREENVEVDSIAKLIFNKNESLQLLERIQQTLVG